MKLAHTTLGRCLAAVAVAVPSAALAADPYEEAAAAYGTTEFLEDVWMPATTHAAPTPAVMAATGEPAGLGAASGEPDTAYPVDRAPLSERELEARLRWLESLTDFP